MRAMQAMRVRLAECFGGGRHCVIKRAIFDIFHSGKKLNYPITHLQHNSLSAVKQYIETNQQQKMETTKMARSIQLWSIKSTHLPTRSGQVSN